MTKPYMPIYGEEDRRSRSRNAMLAVGEGLFQRSLKDHERVVARLKELSTLTHPLQHPHVIKLEGGKKGERFRLRVGDYRVKFTFHKPSLLLVTRIQHRQAGY